MTAVSKGYLLSSQHRSFLLTQPHTSTRRVGRYKLAAIFYPLESAFPAPPTPSRRSKSTSTKACQMRKINVINWFNFLTSRRRSFTRFSRVAVMSVDGNCYHCLGVGLPKVSISWGSAIISSNKWANYCFAKLFSLLETGARLNVFIFSSCQWGMFSCQVKKLLDKLQNCPGRYLIPGRFPCLVTGRNS